MFNNLEESKIENGNFTAEGDSTMFEESKKLDIGGGFYLATTERKGKGVDSDSEDEGPKMFQGLEESTLRDGVFVAEGRGQMFKKSKKLIIEGGNYTASGTGTKARKSKNTAKPSQQGYGSPLPSGFPGSSSSIPLPYNLTAIRQPHLQPQSVPATSSGSTFQGAAAFGASVPLTHTQTVPTLPSEAQDYFPNYDVPNHRMQQASTNVVQGSSSTNFAAAPMDVDANNEASSEFDKGKGKKDNKFAHGVKKIWKKQGISVSLSQ